MKRPSYDEADYLSLSGIQHYCYCKRQWAIIHIEQQWEEDGRTAAGQQFHRNVDDPFADSTRGGVIISRSVPVSSSLLGLSGVCDTVELRPDENGSYVLGHKGLYKTVPVEYKVGRRKAGEWDAVQLCAQAIALEESLGVVVEEGQVFYGQERRRLTIPIDGRLRDETKCISDEMHTMFESGQMPLAEASPKCRGCSLFNLCLPKLDLGQDAKTYITKEVGRL